VTRVAIVLAGGDPVHPHIGPRLPADAFVVAADSGLHLASGLGLHVDLVVGDFDSVEPDAVDAAVAAGARVERHPVAKDATDLELAMDAAAREGVARIVVVGGAGGRLDHFLANIALLTSPRYASITVDAFVGDARVTVVHGGPEPATIDAAAGEHVSLLPVGGRGACGITTKGLEYPLEHEDLPLGTTRGVSNVVVDAPASVTLAEGTLLVVRP
jgi:thiamine pyrophosphokinase